MLRHNREINLRKQIKIPQETRKKNILTYQIGFYVFEQVVQDIFTNETNYWRITVNHLN